MDLINTHGSIFHYIRNSANDELLSYKNYESHLKWIIQNGCTRHGNLCSNALAQRVTSGLFLINEKNVDKFCEAYFGYLDDKPRIHLISELKKLFDTDSYDWRGKYIDISNGTGKPITGGFYFIYVDASDEKRRVFISLAQITKQPALDHYSLKDYYEGSEERVENALKYITYKDVKSKGYLKEN